jgi:siroheme decarboxylase
MKNIEQRLLNDYQHHFPLIPAPYTHIAHELKTSTQTVLNLLGELNFRGKVSRVGPVFKPNMLGVSTLAAMCVPEDQLAAVATLINDFPEVNHNYEREHHLNLWFVIVAPDQSKLDAVIDAIQSSSGYEVMNLPLLKEYHIDLGFRMDTNSRKKADQNRNNINERKSRQDFDHRKDEQLIAVIQAGLPLVERPYFAIGEQLGLTEQTVIQKISDLQTAGIIRRLGIIVRHHELGYRANAMLVWDVPDDRVDELGKQLSAEDDVTLCYQRSRIKPRWPYNLFSMIHGKNREEVMDCIERLVQKLALDSTPYEILFSRQRFKQCGAKYFKPSKMLS